MEDHPQSGKEYFKTFTRHLIVHLSVTAILALAELAITFFISLKYHFSALEITLICLILIITTIFLSINYYKKHDKNLPVYPNIDPDFEIICHERIHRYNSLEEYNHKRRYKLRALKNGLTHYSDKFSWTGKEYELLGGTDDYSVNKKDFQNLLDVYEFTFKKPLSKNEIIEVEAEWKLKGHGKPFFSAQIEEPTDRLIMKVVIDPFLSIKKINCATEPYKAAKQSFETRRENLNSDGEFTWIVNSPKLFYHYEITWEEKT